MKTLKTNPGSDKVQSATVAMDMTLFIRLLEVAREELKSDNQLHQLAERCSQQAAAKGAPLTMDDYSVLMPQQAQQAKTGKQPTR